MGPYRPRVFLSISDGSAAYAARSSPMEIRVAGQTQDMARYSTHVRRAAGIATSPIEKLWLSKAEQHLEKYVTGNRTDNTVYVVSLSTAPIAHGSTLRLMWSRRGATSTRPGGLASGAAELHRALGTTESCKLSTTLKIGMSLTV